MNKKLGTAIGCVSIVIALLLVAPIGYWIDYKILQAIEATELMWFLFWIRVPFSMLLLVAGNVVAYYSREAAK